MTESKDGECPPARLVDAVSVAKSDNLRGIQHIDDVLRDYPRDSRLHFLRGSLLAGLERYSDAHEAMATAVKLAPDYTIARFQLGLLELSSGNASAAESTWALLERLPPANALRLFVRGLRHLIRDDFATATELLKQGIELNQDNPAINADMQLIIDKIEQRDPGQADEQISATHLLLRQYTAKPTKH